MAKKPRLVDKLKENAEVREKAQVERQHLKAVGKLKQQLARSEQRCRLAESELERAEARVDFLRSIDEPKPVAIRRAAHKSSGSATAILLLSDWHVEERVDPSTVNGFNEFNLDIASKRIKAVFDRTVLLLEAERRLSKINDMVVALLGDFITGYIHRELEESNYLSPTEATLFAQDHIAGGLDFLLKQAGVKSITVPTATGNHGRTQEKPRVATDHKNSFEWLMYKQLERYYRNEPRITFKVSNGYHNWLTIQDKDNRFHHGHAFRYQGGAQGAGVPIRRKIARWNEKRHAWRDWFGHLHFYVEDEMYVQNASLIGYGAYGEFAVGGDTKAMQTMAVVDRNRDIPVTVKPVFCD